MVDPAFAGHEGDAGSPMVFPHEIMGAVAVLGIIGLLLIVLAVAGIWLLVRIDRRLKHSGQETEQPHQSPSHRSDT
jgi:hypothetical protein